MNSLIHFFDFSNQSKKSLDFGDVYQGKFVQIKHQQLGEYIVFAPQTVCVFHAQIMNLFCNQQSPPWAYEMNNREDDGKLYEEEAEIVGGGYFEIYEDKKRLNLSGSSKAFGSYSPYDLDQKLNSVPRFSEYTVFC